MRKGMRRAICAVYVECWKDRLYYRKHNGIVQCYFEHVSQRSEKRNTYQSKSRRRRRVRKIFQMYG